MDEVACARNGCEELEYRSLSTSPTVTLSNREEISDFGNVVIPLLAVEDLGEAEARRHR